MINCNIEELKINIKSVPYFSEGNIESIKFGADVKDIELSYLNGDYEIPENVKVAFANKMPKEYDFSELTVPKSIEIFGAYCPKKNGNIFSNFLSSAYIPLLDENYTLYGYTGTSAEEYAKEFDIPFVALDGKAEEIKGDANCDGNVNMADAVMIMQSLANPDKYGVNGKDDTHITAQGEKNGDMDGNGLTNADALEIQKRLLKLS